MNAAHRALIRMIAPVSILAGAAACHGLVNLDETPRTFVDPASYFKTPNQAIAAVNGIYSALMTWDDWISPAWRDVACEGPDIYCPSWPTFGYRGAHAGAWFAGRTWTGNYLIIRRANDVLGQLERVDLDPTLEERLRGEAHFLRGYAYFELVRRYGTVPLRLAPYTPDGTYGDAPRAPLPDVYAAIVNDLKAATQELPADFSSKTYTSADRGRPTAPAAWGLLAKVYLTLAGAELAGTPLAAARLVYHDSARSAAQQVAQSGWVTLETDYMRLFDWQQQVNSNEILFQVGGTHQENTGTEVGTFLNPPDYSTVGGGAGGALSMRQVFYETFEPNDRRVEPGYAVFAEWKRSGSASDPGVRTWFRGSVPDSITAQISPANQVGSAWVGDNACDTVGWNRYDLGGGRFVELSPQIYTMKYVDRTALTKSQNSNNPIVLRFADVLLVLAEAENEVNGPTLAAYGAIDQVRNRAGVGPLTPGLAQAQFREAVWLERRHELYAEFHEWFDLKRQGRWRDIMNDVIPAYPGSSRPNASICQQGRRPHQLLLPIPAAEIGANRLITQNPGY
jgi:hypothetical protein